MEKEIRVLYYNWAPLEGNGGGVAVYMRNLVRAINTPPTRREISFKVVFLSSGYYYDETCQPRIVKSECDLRAECYHIVNSPITAPLETMATRIGRIGKDSITVQLIAEFITKCGPFDVIHFHSFEGISPRVLELKKRWPQTKFVHTIHDYGIICPNVKLWTFDGRNCYHSQGKCEQCMTTQMKYTQQFHIDMRLANTDRKREELYAHYKQKRQWLWRMEKLLAKVGWRWCLRDQDFQRYRAMCIDMVNRYSDAELCVSQRVAEIVATAGVVKRKIIVDYIGTAVADKSMGQNRNNPFTDTFTILYMGYMTEAKGGFMLLNCLENLKKRGKTVIVRMATKIPDEATHLRIEQLRQYYKGVELYDGYTHDDFPVLFCDVNLGIVPPLWEDNLPQIAIEMIANGIPVLTSHNGGAHELNSHSVFCFSEAHELEEKLVKIIDDRQLLIDYWNHATALTTMKKHIDNLTKIYQSI